MEYLKSEVGEVLAKGLAETVTANPREPIEFLGNWIHHYLDERDNESKRKIQKAKEAQEKDEWNKVAVIRQQGAASTIQREWKMHQIHETERQAEEAALAANLREMEREIEEVEDFREEAQEEGQEDVDANEDEKEKEQERLRALVVFRKAKALLLRVERPAFGTLKRMQRPAPELVTVLRCALYLLSNKKPKEVRTWDQIHNLFKPTPFLNAVSNLDPSTNGAKKRQYLRVGRILRGIEDESVKQSHILVFVILQFLKTAIDFRLRRDEERKLKMDLGKDVPEDEGEEEEDAEEENPEADGIDPDEERERLAEEEAQRKAEEEAKLAAEMEEDEGEGDGDD